MKDDFMFLPIPMQKQQMLQELLKCNEFTSRYGVQLSPEEAGLLMEARKESLSANGRIEFGAGVMQRIIMEFADSPYLYQDNYLSTLLELQECFYYFKNETLDELSDDELIHLMKYHFDHDCQGSAEYLQSTVLENISHDVRYGREQEEFYE